MAISKIITSSLTDDVVTSAKIGTDQVGADALSSSAISGAVDIPANSVGESELSVDYTAQSVPHIVPGVLYPAVEGKTLSGVAVNTAHGSTYTYGTTINDGTSLKYYYTDIKGSKPIKDPRVGGHFGSQRHKFKSLQLLEQETATHGKNVHSVDGRENIRVVGEHYETQNTASGNNLILFRTNYSDNNGHFLEVTGYFSDANFIQMTYTDVADGSDVYIDGALVESNRTARTTSSTPLGGRYVDTGSVFRAFDTSQTLGIHTLKYTWVNSAGTTNAYQYIYGIELIAQDLSGSGSPNRSKIKFPAQNVVSFGKKFEITETNHHYDPFNGFTSGSSVTSYIDTTTSLGVENWKSSSTYYRPYNGGRVVKWVDSSGVIKTSVTLMPPNAQNIGGTDITPKANASVANNTYLPTFSGAIDDSLSESSKTFIIEEFGNGAANSAGGAGTSATYADASMLTGSSDSIAYVMDDGLTSLSANDVTKGNHASTGGYLNTGNGDDVYTTFIGTGVTLGITNWNGDGKLIEKVAFNLPYGTHILKVSHQGSNVVKYIIDGVEVKSVTSSVWGPIDFTFHQPKKPPIPEDACVLADFMLLADFVAIGASGIDKISKGVRLNSASRDFFADTSDSTLTMAQDLGGSFITGFKLYTGSTNANALTARLPSFGTNFVVRGYNIEQRCDLYVGSTDSAQTDADGNGSYAYLNSNVTLGVNNFLHKNNASQNGVFSHYEIATPIHTSSHYQPFETPFLNELFGGDRNMEQTNLVCSPDGKSWDQLTRDTSYLGNNLVYLEAVIAPYTNYTGTDVRGAFHHKFLSKRGTIDLVDMTNKGNWALAYDRLVCLVPGQYHIEVCNRIHSGSSQNAIDILKNGVRIGFFENGSAANYSCFCSADATFKRGDYLQADHNRVTANNYYTGEAGECNVRIFKV